MEDVMADRVSASIELGGVLSALNYQELCEVIAGEGLATDGTASRSSRIIAPRGNRFIFMPMRLLGTGSRRWKAGA
jgi:hypothetical protein